RCREQRAGEEGLSIPAQSRRQYGRAMDPERPQRGRAAGNGPAAGRLRNSHRLPVDRSGTRPEPRSQDRAHRPPMTSLLSELTATAGAAFAAEGMDAASGQVQASDRPEAQFQVNGALAAAKKVKANPRELAGKVASH